MHLPDIICYYWSCSTLFAISSPFYPLLAFFVPSCLYFRCFLFLLSSSSIYLAANGYCRSNLNLLSAAATAFLIPIPTLLSGHLSLYNLPYVRYTNPNNHYNHYILLPSINLPLILIKPIHQHTHPNTHVIRLHSSPIFTSASTNT